MLHTNFQGHWPFGVGVPVYLVPPVSCPRDKIPRGILSLGTLYPRGRMSPPGLSCPLRRDTIGTVSCPRGHFTLG